MITTVAPAKINWTLEVLGRRDDGYHEIRTVLQTIELHDELTLEPGAGEGIRVTGSQTPPGEDLIVRAADLFGVASGWSSGVDVRVVKRIPVAAGLGGASSDAAATLRALQAASEEALNESELMNLAATIGSDVPFFLRGGTALGQGRGEVLTPLPDPEPAWLVLVVPAIRIPNKTGTMYAWLADSDFSGGGKTGAFVDRVRSDRLIPEDLLSNAFERAAFETFPALRTLHDWMLQAGARSVHLCGAGPSLFALASGEPEARAIRARLNRQRKGERVYVVRTVTADEATLMWTDVAQST